VHPKHCAVAVGGLASSRASGEAVHEAHVSKLCGNDRSFIHAGCVWIEAFCVQNGMSVQVKYWISNYHNKL
jgi:hypothetical protein